MDEKKNISELKEIVKDFCDDRDWDQFHNVKDLSLALSIEVSELLELFRWKTNDELDEFFKDEFKREKFEDELSDVFYFVLRIAQKNDVDLSEAFERKMKKNCIKYPIQKAKGSNKKYTEL